MPSKSRRLANRVASFLKAQADGYVSVDKPQHERSSATFITSSDTAKGSHPQKNLGGYLHDKKGT